jgi:Cu(I)/Ag(I) efflux system membrane fusion protein
MEIQNSKGLLKPAMFASVKIGVDKHDRVLTVPTSAVIDSGTRLVVLVRLAEGRFEPRTVTLGSHSDDYVEVLSGIMAGEQVVTSANFLIDAESNLKAALSGLGAVAASTRSTPTQPPLLPAAQNPPQPPLTRDGAIEGHSKNETIPKPVAVQKKLKAVSYQAQGKLEAINSDGTVSITHEPIKSLGWPGMTMDFALANSALAAGIQPGSTITFEIVERKPDEWVITKLQAQPQHEGH